MYQRRVSQKKQLNLMVNPKKKMYKITIQIAIGVFALLTYKFPVLVPLGFILVAFFLYKMHKILLVNKDVIDKNTEDVNNSITSLLNNQKRLVSDIKTLKSIIDKHGKKTGNKI
jgi:hypothetical protein